MILSVNFFCLSLLILYLQFAKEIADVYLRLNATLGVVLRPLEKCYIQLKYPFQV